MKTNHIIDSIIREEQERIRKLGIIYLDKVHIKGEVQYKTKLEDCKKELVHLDKLVEFLDFIEKEGYVEYVKKPCALEYTRRCMKEKLDVIESGIIYNIFFNNLK